DRIINFFPEDRRSQLLMDLSLNLKGVVAQQLVPTPDGKGRRVAMEILLGTPLVQDYIRDGEIHKLKEVMKESTNLGMKTFDQSLFELYQAGEISYEDALRYADSQNEVRLRIKLSQGGDARTLSQGLDGVEISEVRGGRRPPLADYRKWGAYGYAACSQCRAHRLRECAASVSQGVARPWFHRADLRWRIAIADQHGCCRGSPGIGWQR